MNKNYPNMLYENRVNIADQFSEIRHMNYQILQTVLINLVTLYLKHFKSKEIMKKILK